MVAPSITLSYRSLTEISNSQKTTTITAKACDHLMDYLATHPDTYASTLAAWYSALFLMQPISSCPMPAVALLALFFSSATTHHHSSSDPHQWRGSCSLNHSVFLFRR
jgi:hypothetical protein